MIRAILKERGTDPMGSGAYGAPRRGRTHQGIDYACFKGAVILSPVAGTVTKLGYCYSDDLSFRYVQVKDVNGYRHRVFYVQPSVAVGDVVTYDDEIGTAQDIEGKWGGGMKNHVHYEILKGETGKESVDPKVYWGVT